MINLEKMITMLFNGAQKTAQFVNEHPNVVRTAVHAAERAQKQHNDKAAQKAANKKKNESDETNNEV